MPLTRRKDTNDSTRVMTVTFLLVDSVESQDAYLLSNHDNESV